MTRAEMVTLWRKLTNETDVVVVPDALIYLYLQRGLEALNRRVGYYWKDDSTTALVAGMHEHDLPVDAHEIVFVYWDTRKLKKVDMETLDDQEVDWRNREGPPAEYLLQGNRLILVPIPTAEAIATAGFLTIRYVANPQTLPAGGPDKLQGQDHPIPVYYAVVLWSSSHPDSGLATHRIEQFNALFENEAKVIAAQYQSRRLAR